MYVQFCIASNLLKFPDYNSLLLSFKYLTTPFSEMAAHIVILAWCVSCGSVSNETQWECGFDFIRDSDSYLFPPLPQLCLPLIPPPRILTRLPIALPRACCCSSGLWKSSILKKMVVIVLWAIYINMLKLDWLINEWLIQIELQLEVICQISRHYKQCQCQIFMEYTWLCIQIFHNLMDHFERDVLDDEKLLRSCEEFDSLSENRLNQLDQQVLLRISFLIWEMHQSDWEKL